jgi:hypothetical protein
MLHCRGPTLWQRSFLDPRDEYSRPRPPRDEDSAGAQGCELEELVWYCTAGMGRGAGCERTCPSSPVARLARGREEANQNGAHRFCGDDLRREGTGIAAHRGSRERCLGSGRPRISALGHRRSGLWTCLDSPGSNLVVGGSGQSPGRRPSAPVRSLRARARLTQRLSQRFAPWPRSQQSPSSGQVSATAPARVERARARVKEIAALAPPAPSSTALGNRAPATRRTTALTRAAAARHSRRGRSYHLPRPKLLPTHSAEVTPS